MRMSGNFSRGRVEDESDGDAANTTGMTSANPKNIMPTGMPNVDPAQMQQMMMMMQQMQMAGGGKPGEGGAAGEGGINPM